MSTDPHLTLHQLFSPAFPVGAFAWSHGLETAVQSGAVADADGLQDWLETVLRQGAGWTDAVLLAQAATGGDADALAELALALSPSAERRAETAEQGAAFAATVRSVWQVDLPDAPYPVAVGCAVAALGLPLADALRLYLQAFAANLCSAGVRAIPLGQTDGQRITLALAPLCAELAEAALTATLDDIGGFAPIIDIQSQRHAALHSRVFRS
ncbi:urease accessory protein UreF [Aestuariicoccus sp. MJ-SS9]|uniref:urease accessory protein UreF n=1 Tax=Aestuariicoccus sp. MJ-SS9 TaxID=3079855 RepID=UPI002907E6E9|nr:urease accessory protein UreF [Aestuariicoccus sp. MJ-SS9]MDU8912038.1 urease accessory protein UreF [Aestuariicoccus sp. MJ-SS9]